MSAAFLHRIFNNLNLRMMKKIVLIVVAAVIMSANLYSQSAVELNNSFWNAKISGNTLLLLKLKLDKDKFAFVSREGSSHDILGSKYFAGRLSGKVRAHTIEIKGTWFLKNDTIFLEGEYKSLTSTQNFSGTISNNELAAVLSGNEISGRRTLEYAPLRDFYSIAKSAIDSSETYLFNPEILKTKEWREFKEKVLRLSMVVADDYEFEKMFNFNGIKLPFTHYGIGINAPQKNSQVQSSQNTKAEEQPQKFEIQQINTETVLFTVKTFSATEEEIRPFIDSLKTMNFANLIVDLRNNGGGTIASALPLARYLVQDTLYGGLFLTHKYFSQHAELPEPDSYTNFPLFSEASFPLIIDGIHNEEGLCLVMYPDDKTFSGDLYILANRNTASTCEPLIYGLKTEKYAVIIGETTSGAMLNGEKFAINNEFYLWMPTADYYTADGFKIDKAGVEPDIEADPAEALEKALETIDNKKKH